MKKNLKVVFSIMLALVMALAALPVSALPRLEAEKTAVEPYWTVPDGYNAHDYTKCVEFLEQTDEDGVKNGEKLSENYDPNDPGTWGERYFYWTDVDIERRVSGIWFGSSGNAWSVQLIGALNVSGFSELYALSCWQAKTLESIDASNCPKLVWIDCTSSGISTLNIENSALIAELDCSLNNLTALDVSGCTALQSLACSYNHLTELDISGCCELESLYCSENNLTELDVTQNTALWLLSCTSNSLTELDVTQNTALQYLHCSDNNLVELDVMQNTALKRLYCDNNNLVELDVNRNTELRSLDCSDNNLIALEVTNNTELKQLYCYDNNLTSLDLSNNSMLAYDNIRAEGFGYVGYSSDYYEYDDMHRVFIYAYPVNSAVFEGFYDENGALIAEGEWSDEYERYSYGFYGNATGTIIARFSVGALPGDIDSNGSVSTADAITTLRLAMQLLDGSGMNTDAADMDGNGSITLADAIIILRTAMGLA